MEEVKSVVEKLREFPGCASKQHGKGCVFPGIPVATPVAMGNKIKNYFVGSRKAIMVTSRIYLVR